MRLYRPVGLHELRLIVDAEFRAFPPRLAHQPIFYPVLELAYAEQIARDWNTRDPASGFAGFVTRFDVAESRAARYPIQVVGASAHRELWVPAEELDGFNADLTTRIEVVAHFLGSGFVGTLDDDNLPPLGVPAPRKPTAWSVLRLDDNGNQYVVDRDLGLEAALRVVASFEARGHKQTYWAQLESESAGSEV